MLGPSFLVSTPAFGRRWFDPPAEQRPDGGSEARLWGMFLFIASLSMLFAGSLTAYFITRAQVPGLRAAMPPAPSWLYVGTALLVISSATMQQAVRAARQGRLLLLRNAMFATLALGCTFLAVQFATWVHFTRVAIDPTSNLAAFSVYLLTVLHALHVVGGLVGLTWVSLRANRRYYSRTNSTGVRACALYWHFLDAVWLVLFAALFVWR